jgi:DNA-binding PadR family transcriptional regulator
MPKGFLGEFEQMVLLAILQQGDHAFGLEVRREIERSAKRSVSRSAFYTTLDRMEKKGLVAWTEGEPEGSHRKAPVRLFRVTKAGREALGRSRQALRSLWRGLDEIVEET